MSEVDIPALRLDIGSGNRPREHREGWTHIDLDTKAPQLDVHADATNIPYPDNTASEIYTSHLIEHLPPAQIPAFLSECHRLLGRGCWISIHTPHFTNMAQAMEEMPVAHWADLMYALYGTDDWGAHQCMFNARMLSTMLRQHGFVDTRDATRDWKDSHDEAWAEVMGGRYMSLKVVGRKQ